MTLMQHVQPSADEQRRAAIYRRVSTDKQEREGASLDEQERLCRELAESEYEVVEVYTDVLSGADPNRPDYNRMLNDAIAGRFEAIAIYALDRFGRDVIQVTTSLKTLDQVGVKVLSVRGTVDRDTPEGQLMTTIEAAFGEFERAKIKIRTKMGVAAKLRKGIPHGVPAFGYDTGPDGYYVVNQQEAEVLRRMFRYRVEEGLSYHRLAARLNTEGLVGKFGHKWTAPSVKIIIESKAALGYLNAGSFTVECPTCHAAPGTRCKRRDGSELKKQQAHHQARANWVKGKHAPIIDEATWSAALGMAADNKRFAPSGAGRRPKRHLFVNGHLRCGVCGSAMQCVTGKTPEQDFYVCATHRAHVQSDDGPCFCPTGWHKRASVDRGFLALFEATFLDYDATREQVAARLDQNITDARAQLDTAESELARIERQAQRVEADYFAEELGAVAYDRLSAKVADDRVAASAERDRLADHVARLTRARAEVDAESETLRRLTALRNTVASHARDALAQQDVEALRGLIASAFGNAFLEDGSIVALTPGARMKTAGQAVPLLVIGDEVLPGATGDGASNELPLRFEDGKVEVEWKRYAVPLDANPSNDGAVIEKVTSLTL
jgi:DNA invertase Pin-like site-specific DNA recombinase